MLIIRLQRKGRRNHAEFRIVLSEHKRSAKSGDVLAVLGNYNPNTDVVNLDAEAIKAWMQKGAQVSDTVHNILVTQKVIEGKKRNVLPKKTVPVKDEVTPAAKEEASAEPKIEADVTPSTKDEAPAEPASETPEVAQA